MNNNTLTITEKKAQATLDKIFNFPEGIMTRRKYMDLQKSLGATVKETMKSKTHFNRTKFKRMDNAEQEEYERRLGNKVPCYEVWFKDGGFMDITKAEYDYFNSI